MSSDFLGKSIIVSAPSGAGKTTLVKYLLSERKDIAFSISATNRPIRKGEKEGVDYYFFDSSEFKAKIKEGHFVEWEEVYEGRFYGTLRSEVDRIWEKKTHVIFDVDVVGGLHLKKKFGERALSIFISTGDIETLEKRLRERCTESEEDIQTRIKKADEEMQTASQFDVIIINRDLEKAQKEIEEIASKFLSNA